MSIVATENGLLLTMTASVLDTERVVAWAKRSMIPNNAYTYLVAKYVEADKPNLNQNYWSFADLKGSQDTIKYSPVNMLHSGQRIVGSIIDTEMVYPTDVTAGYEYANPYIEALIVFYKHYFPREHDQIVAAHNEGSLSVSMECMGETVTCAGPNGCGETYPFQGAISEGYCDHINKQHSVCAVNKPHFLGCGIILPPAKPAWSGAEVSELVAANKREPDTWQARMDTILDLWAKDFSTNQRKDLAKSGAALPDGSYPIQNEQDLRNAIQAIGRAKDPAAAKAHIKKRAAALGLTKLIPDTWK